MQTLPSSSTTMHSNYYGTIHTSGGQAMGRGYGMLPPHQATNYASGVSGVLSSQGQTISAPSATSPSFNSTQMQTPPPTGHPSAKKSQHIQSIPFGTPSTIASRRFMTPQQHIAPNNAFSMSQQTPMQFPQLQFSPEAYHFGNFGPASAPVFTQNSLLWDPATSPGMYAPQTFLEDPFAPATSSSMAWSNHDPQPGNNRAVSFNTPGMRSFSVQASHPLPAPAVPLASNATQAPMLGSNPAGVDPSLVYSSPLRPVEQSNVRSKKPRPIAPLIDTRRRDSGSAEHARSDTVSSVNSLPSNASKALRRSNTTSLARPRSAHPWIGGEDVSVRGHAAPQVPRTSSPLKRIGKPMLGSISETKSRSRTSVVLTVDEFGRARTETRRVEDSPTRSARERYPGLFDSDSSDAESEDSDVTPSHSISYSFTTADGRKPKAAKLDPPIENLEGLSIPRSSSSTSMRVAPSGAALAAAAQLRRGSSFRKSTPNRNVAKHAMIASTTSSMDTSHPQRSISSIHHSSHGLTSQGPDWSNSTLDAHNRRWSSISLGHRDVEMTLEQSGQHQQPRSSQRTIRCVCGIASEQGQPLIQCHLCSRWLHSACVGLHHSARPPSFTCFLCAKPSSARRARP